MTRQFKHLFAWNIKCFYFIHKWSLCCQRESLFSSLSLQWINLRSIGHWIFVKLFLSSGWRYSEKPQRYFIKLVDNQSLCCIKFANVLWFENSCKLNLFLKLQTNFVWLNREIRDLWKEKSNFSVRDNILYFEFDLNLLVTWTISEFKQISLEFHQWAMSVSFHLHNEWIIVIKLKHDRIFMTIWWFERCFEVRLCIIDLLSRRRQSIILSVYLILVRYSTFTNQLYLDLWKAFDFSMIRLTKQYLLILFMS